MRLGDGSPSLWQYVPDLDWHAVRTHMGPSQLYDVLAPPSDANNAPVANTGEGAADAVLRTVCRVLDVGAGEASVDVPLTAYGLDSLSASALSHALRPLLMVSQVQLLANVTIKDLQKRVTQDVV